MAPLPFEPVELIAVDPALNVRRRWQVDASRDLFGHMMVETRWGRIGEKGQRLVRSFPDEEGAARYVAGLLRLRGTAERRIGVAYQPVTKGPTLR